MIAALAVSWVYQTLIVEQVHWLLLAQLLSDFKYANPAWQGLCTNA